MFAEMRFVEKVELFSTLMSYIQILVFFLILFLVIKSSLTKNKEKTITLFKFIEIFSVNLIILTLSWSLIVIAGDFIIASLMVDLSYVEYIKEQLKPKIIESVEVICYKGEDLSPPTPIEYYMNQFKLSSLIQDYNKSGLLISSMIVFLFVLSFPMIQKKENSAKVESLKSMFLEIFFIIIFAYTLYFIEFFEGDTFDFNDKILFLISLSVIGISFLIGFISLIIKLLKKIKP